MKQQRPRYSEFLDLTVSTKHLLLDLPCLVNALKLYNLYSLLLIKGLPQMSSSKCYKSFNRSHGRQFTTVFKGYKLCDR